MTRNRPLKLQRCYEVAFSNSGAKLVTLSRDVVGWDVAKRQKTFRAHPVSHPSTCSIHPNEALIAVKNAAGHIVLVSADNGDLIGSLNVANDNEGSNIMFSACGEYLVDGSWKGELKVRDASSGKQAFAKVFPGEMITDIARTPRGDRWYVVHQPKATVDDKPPASAYISVWAWPFKAPLDFIMIPDNRIEALAVSPDASQLCVLGCNTMMVIALSDKSVVASVRYTFGGTQHSLDWSPDSKEVAAIQRHEVTFHRAANLERSASFDLQYASDVAYSPDGRLIAMGSWSSGLLMERTDAQQGAPSDVARLASLGVRRA